MNFFRFGRLKKCSSLTGEEGKGERVLEKGFIRRRNQIITAPEHRRVVDRNVLNTALHFTHQRHDDVITAQFVHEELVNETVALMKRLIIDAQAKFRKMVDENKQLLSRVDGEMQNAQEQVNNLREDLAETKKRLDEHINNKKTDGGSGGGAGQKVADDPIKSPNNNNNNHNHNNNQRLKTNKDVTNNTNSGGSKLNTNPFAENPFDSSLQSAATATTTAPTEIEKSEKTNFFNQKKGVDFFSSKLTDSAGIFFGNNFGGKSGNKTGAGNNASEDGERRENSFVDSIASKLFKQTSLDTGTGTGSRSIKPEEFVVTSNLKLNFLTAKSSSPGTPETARKSTGAVPKRSKPSDSTCKTSEPESASDKVKSTDQFVRPLSPLPSKQDEDSGKPGHKKSTSWEGNQTTTLSRLKLENEKLHREIESLKSQLSKKKKKSSSNRSSSLDATDSGSEDESPSTKSRIQELEEEVMQTREALTALKLDKKRLKNEKFDLLNQMKQLYGTLEDKEKELRDFIRNYEQRIRESESSLQQLSTEREERERERWSLLRHARDEAERSLSLATQLAAKDAHIQQLQENLDEARRQVSGSCLSDQESLASMSISRMNGSTGGMTPTTTTAQVPLGLGLLPGDRGSCSADSGVRGSSDRESGGATSGGGTPTLTQDQNQMSARLDMDSVSISSSVNPSHVYQTVSTPKDCSPSLSPLNATTFSRSIDNSVLSRSVEQLSSPMEEPRRKSHHSRLTGRGGAWGSISRVFTRNRHRKVSSPSSQEDSPENYRSWSPLTEEGYAEKLRLLREAATIPMERWRAPTVLAWLEVALGMPQYGSRCAENIKSGKVLLELSDLELECGLGVTHPMHRKKLRLAIEEHRHPALVRYPCVAQLSHTWVSNEWLPDLGLGQYTENFATNMVDARMLDHLSKKELEKFLGVTRKFHQASIVHGIHLLRMMKYDRQALAVRRHQCDSVDADPLVWTNQRFIKWARNIDLSEYSDNLKDSGVHGALVVLEPSFNGDTMATALGIPPSKNIIRRHLAAELEALILPARYVIFCQMEEYQAEVARAVNNVKHIQRSTFEEVYGRTQRRVERFLRGGSLGRNLAKNIHEGFADFFERASSKAEMTETEGNPRLSSIRLQSLNYIKKGSLSRVLSFKQSRQFSFPNYKSYVRPIQSPTSSEYGSVVSSFSYRASSPLDLGRPSSPTFPSSADADTDADAQIKNFLAKRKRRHRRAKSIGDIRVQTPV